MWTGDCRPSKRPRITRSALLKPEQQTDPALRLEMAICGNEVDGEEVLEVKPDLRANAGVARTSSNQTRVLSEHQSS